MSKKITALIEYILCDMNLPYDKKTKYFHCSNPITAKTGGLDKSYSAQWDRKTGGIKIWNGDTINSKTYIPLNEIISFLEYQDIHKEITGISNFNSKVFYSENKVNKKKTINKTPPKEVDITESLYNECINYLRGRNLEIVKNLIEPCAIEFDGKYGKFKAPYIAMRYPNGFAKYRNIRSKSKKDRFISFGADGYKEFFTVRKNGTKKLKLIEGEFEAVCMSNYTNDDVKAMHNLNTIPNNIKHYYEEVEVLIDHGKFYEVTELTNGKNIFYNKLQAVFPNANIIIRPKLYIWFNGSWDYNGKNQREYDFNDFHKHNKLTSNIVETGQLSSSDIYNKKTLNKYEFLLDMD